MSEIIAPQYIIDEQKELAKRDAPAKLKKKTKNSGIKAPNYKEHSRALPTSDYTGPIVGKSKQNTYTGTFITGIATMHKSNMVPVSKNVDAKEYATMRRN